jgi:type I restriction enzyme S subunit
MVPLGECCRIVSGSTPKRNKAEYWDGDIPWVTPKDLSKLDSPILKDAPEKITQAGYTSCSTTLMPEGSILFSSRAPIGHVAIAGRAMCTNQGFKSLVPGDKVHSPYLYWCMRQYARDNLPPI